MDSGVVKYFAAIHAKTLRPKVRHALGFPPELARGDDESQELPRPDVLVIEEESEANVFLYRLTRNGEPCGDTWHQSVDDARHQAVYEYGDAIGEWQSIPPEVSDPQEFAVAAVRNQEGYEPG
jgi:hypothetical protein